MSDYTDFLDLWNNVCDNPQVPHVKHENPYEAFRVAIEHLREREDIGGFISTVAHTESFWREMKRYGFENSQEPPVIDRVGVEYANELCSGIGLGFYTGVVTLDNDCINPKGIVCIHYGKDE